MALQFLNQRLKPDALHKINRRLSRGSIHITEKIQAKLGDRRIAMFIKYANSIVKIVSCASRTVQLSFKVSIMLFYSPVVFFLSHNYKAIFYKHDYSCLGLQKCKAFLLIIWERTIEISNIYFKVIFALCLGNPNQFIGKVERRFLRQMRNHKPRGWVLLRPQMTV